MFNKTAEKTMALLILVGAPFTTVFLMTDTVTDPVNATKLAAAGGLGVSLICVAIFFNFKSLFLENKLFSAFSLGFIFAGINAALRSSSPLTQNVYGSYGRNTGLLAYLVLLAVAIAALALREDSTFRKIVLGLQIAGLVNVVYCGWVLLFGDFLSWSNPYGNILGLFGNPNFIGAFLGIFITSIVATLAEPGFSLKKRILGALVCVIAFYEVLRSDAIQGIVVTAGGLAMVLFFAIRARWNSKLILSAYSAIVAGLGVTAVLGALQKGPFTFIYKKSVTLRGEYWDAGIRMGLDNPASGVGMDSYGDWYRRTRSEQAATILPGPKTITNAAHNVVIDFFAFGGFPLLIAYLGLLLIAAISAFKVIRRVKKYDPVFVAMFTSWACYQVQSLISINQVGLALWGWILTGALIAYERATASNAPGKETAQKTTLKGNLKYRESIISPQLVAGLGIVVGLIIAVPPLSADMKWRAALDSKDANKVIEALKPSYLNPSDSQRFAQAVQLFASSNLLDQAHEIALNAVSFNPNYFDAWRVLYFLPNSTEKEKETALAQMKILDPRNPDVLTN